MVMIPSTPTQVVEMPQTPEKPNQQLAIEAQDKTINGTEWVELKRDKLNYCLVNSPSMQDEIDLDNPLRISEKSPEIRPVCIILKLQIHNRSERILMT